MKNAASLRLILSALVVTTLTSAASHGAERVYPFSTLRADLDKLWESASGLLRSVSFTYEWGDVGKPPVMRADVCGVYESGVSHFQGTPENMRIVVHPRKDLQDEGLADGDAYVFTDAKSWAAPKNGEAIEVSGGDCALWGFLSGTFRLRWDYRPYEQLGSESFSGKPRDGKLVGDKLIGGVKYAIYDFPLSKPVYEGLEFLEERQDTDLWLAAYRVYLDPKSRFVIKVQMLNKKKAVIAEQWGENVVTIRPGVKAALKLCSEGRMQEKGWPQPAFRLEYRNVGGRLLPKEYRQVWAKGTTYMRFSDFALNPDVPESLFAPPAMTQEQ